MSSKLVKTKKQKTTTTTTTKKFLKTKKKMVSNLHQLPNKVEMKNDVQQFSSKLRLLEIFYKENEWEEEKSSDDSIIKNKSAFNLPRN